MKKFSITALNSLDKNTNPLMKQVFSGRADELYCIIDDIYGIKILVNESRLTCVFVKNNIEFISYMLSINVNDFINHCQTYNIDVTVVSKETALHDLMVKLIKSAYYSSGLYRTQDIEKAISSILNA